MESDSWVEQFLSCVTWGFTLTSLSCLRTLPCKPEIIGPTHEVARGLNEVIYIQSAQSTPWGVRSAQQSGPSLSESPAPGPGRSLHLAWVKPFLVSASLPSL